MKRLGLFLIPLLAFGLIWVFLLQGLFSDPRTLESTRIEKPLPPFTLPDLMQDDIRYTEKDLTGQVTLLNVWGTWCITCAIELPYLAELQQQGIHIVGLYYEQDTDPDFGGKTLPQIRQEVLAKLGQLGNPYAYNIYDVNRNYSLDLGVTGAPETFLIDSKGVVRLHHIGDVNPQVWQSKFVPVYQALGEQVAP